LYLSPSRKLIEGIGGCVHLVIEFVVLIGPKLAVFLGKRVVPFAFHEDHVPAIDLIGVPFRTLGLLARDGLHGWRMSR
jgi:hypothetical protein